MLIDGHSGAFVQASEVNENEEQLEQDSNSEIKIEISKIYSDLSLVSEEPDQDYHKFRDAIQHQCNMTETIDNNLQKRIYWNVTKFLGGQWRDLSCCELKVEPISGGLSNYLYMCSLPPDKQPKDGEPQSVLVRIFGNLLKQDALVMDCVVFALLAEKGLGPRLHGVFPGGRIEEFIPSVSLTMDDFHQPDISRRIAGQLATFHALHMPVSKDPDSIYSLIQRYGEELTSTDIPSGLAPSTRKRLQSFIEGSDIQNQLSWLRETLKKVNSPIVFCHNDLQAGNVLKFGRPDGGYELKMIDYEFSGYGYRGFDLANHFCEWTFDNFYPDPPYYRYLPEKQPSKQHLLHFFEAYRSDNPDCPKLIDDCLLQEVEYFTLLSHLIWSVWSAAQVVISSIQFDYMSYAECRMELFRKLKAKLASQTIHDYGSS